LTSAEPPRRPPSRITQKGYGAGKRPPNYGRTFPPTLLQPEEVVRLMLACENDKRRLRLRAMIAVLYRAGPLIGEALALRLAEVDRDQGTVRFASQRQTHRTVGMDPTSFEVLDEWLAVRRTLPGDLLFCTINLPEPGRPVHPAYVRTAFGDLAKAAGLAGTRVHPQAFRHSLAAELIIEGWPLSFIQAQLGIETLYAMDRFLKNLDIGPPEPQDVVTAIHTRTWDFPSG
jgi:site-specific recombinase XerD